MRRAGQKRIVPDIATTVTPPIDASARGSLVAEFEFPAHRHTETDDNAVDRRKLPIKIQKRIESRLPGRIRNLAVRVVGDTVVLEGQCATYYTKQLAQHAALGILEDEQLDNAIVVNVPR